MKEKKLTLVLITVLVILVYTVTFPAAFNRGVDFINEKVPFTLPGLRERDFHIGLDLQGGAHLVYEADLSDVPSGERGRRMDGVRSLIERRADFYGIAETIVQVRGERLIVEIPGAHDLDEAIEIIGETPFLEFREIDQELQEKQREKIKEMEDFLGKSLDEEFTMEDIERLNESDIEGWEIIFQSPHVSTGLTGRHLRNAAANINPMTNAPFISLQFDREGAELFEEITERNVGKILATYLDETLLQEAVVREKISGGEAQITGDFDLEYAYDIARDLRIGALPVPINLISQRSIGAALGQESLEDSIRAGLWGFLFISLFMILVYRLPGFLSVLSLIIYGLFLLFLFKIIPVTLTLSGIAAVILSVGMAIDANILIFSRMKEELRSGKSLKESVEEGYRRAWMAIRDGNFTTLIVALILYFIATSFVRGFAITLILGIITSLFAAMVITRAFLALFEETGREKLKKLWI